MEKKASIGQVLARYRKRLGKPVTLEEIFLLDNAVSGEIELSEEDRTRLLDRISADPEAAAKLLKLMRFPEASDESVDRGSAAVAERWAAFSSRLRSEDTLESAPLEPAGIKMSRVPPAKIDRGSPVANFGWQGLSAASFVLGALLTLISVRLPWLSDLAGTTRPGAQINLPLVELLAEGMTVNRGEPIRLPSSADGVIVTLGTRHLEIAGPFNLRLFNPSGDEVLWRDGLEPGPEGVFILSLPRTVLNEGRHRLEIGKGNETVASFYFEVTLLQ